MFRLSKRGHIGELVSLEGETRTHGWTDVEAVAWLGGYPVLIESNKVFDELEEGGTFKGLVFGKDVRNNRTRNEKVFTGRAIRAALEFMRFMFKSGRKRVTRPAGLR